MSLLNVEDCVYIKMLLCKIYREILTIQISDFILLTEKDSIEEGDPMVWIVQNVNEWQILDNEDEDEDNLDYILEDDEEVVEIECQIIAVKKYYISISNIISTRSTIYYMDL